MMVEDCPIWRLTMPRLVPSQCILRPSQIQDLPQLAMLDRAWENDLTPNHHYRWRNFAAIAFTVFSLVVAFKDLKLLGLVLLGFAPVYLIVGWLYYVSQHPPQQAWVNYWVVECNDRVIAAAKWEHFDSYSELQRLYVMPKWRSHGLASSLVDRLVSQTTQPVYVLSDRRSQRFFSRFGFNPIEWDDLPQNFPVPEFTVPGLERSQADQVPMIRYAPPIPQRRSATTPPLKSARPAIPGWQGIKPEIDDRRMEN
jgi:amino-acid N-acetyltransferase